MASLKEKLIQIRVIDFCVLALLAALIFWPGWQELLVLKPLLIVSVLSVYFFDSGSNKKVSWLLVFLATTFYVAFFQQDLSVPYTAFGMAQVALIVWISIKLLTRSFGRLVWTFIGCLVFLVTAILSLGWLQKQEEMYLFLALQAGLCFLPILIEREELGFQQEVWCLSGFQQLVGRAFFVFWSIHHQYEIKALNVFDQTHMFFISGMVFLPVFALVNWKNIKWDFLHESFISLLVMYGLISGKPLAVLTVAVLVLVGATGTVNRMISVPQGGLQKSLRALEAGGFGGFYFLLSIAAAYAIHFPMRGMGFAILTSIIFIFAWAGAIGNKVGKSVVMPRRIIWSRLVFQMISPIWLIWIFVGN